MTVSWSLRLFGPPALMKGRVLGTDTAVLAAVSVQRRPMALLAMLAVAGPRGVARERLIARLWPDAEADSARNALRQTLFTLRRVLESPDAVGGTTFLYLDDALVTSDVQAFIAMAREGDRAGAVHVYAGPLLDGFALRGCAEFEQWVEGERASFARKTERLLNDLAQAATERGDHASAVHWWARASEQDPLSGRVACGYLRALTASGDHPAAIQYAQRYAARLQRELEVTPDEEFVRLAVSIRERCRVKRSSPPRVDHVRGVYGSHATRGLDATAPRVDERSGLGRGALNFPSDNALRQGADLFPATSRVRQDRFERVVAYFLRLLQGARKKRMPPAPTGASGE